MDVTIAGGGPAGFFAAIQCKQNAPAASVTILERGPRLLTKVAISGGGRCNVTHACFDPRLLAGAYPRGGRELIGPFQRWNATHTRAWFADHGVPLKTEDDGRMFPLTDSSRTVIDCLLDRARGLGVEITTRQGISEIHPRPEGAGFDLQLDDGCHGRCDLLLVATGGHRTPAGYRLASCAGHTIVPPVPSLFTFRIDDPRLQGLSGVSVPHVEVRALRTRLRQSGPLLVTGWGLSGPAILKLSAWGARELSDLDYRFDLQVNFAAGLPPDELAAALPAARSDHARKGIAAFSPVPLPRRLWRAMVAHAGIPEDVTWASLSRRQQQQLTEQLQRARFAVRGKSLNKDEFVTCGGVSLPEVDMRTMESRIQPGLFFAGEVLDIDGITGGFNLQSAWTTGWLAGSAMAERAAATGCG
jgi:predicted Rossmann fold flavoprotein